MVPLPTETPASTPPRTRRTRPTGDAGSALVEFVGVAALLLVPLVYLVLAAGQLQAAAFAVEGAAREGGRLAVTAPDVATGAERAQAAAVVALADAGVRAEPVVSLSCERDPCLQPDARVSVSVEVLVAPPGAGALGAVPVTVPVRASSVAVVDRFAR
jgi:hypothetical protein